jgi:hypothetical protein
VLSFELKMRVGSFEKCLKVGKLTKVEFKVAKKRAQKSEKIGFVLHISSLVARVSWFVIRGS